MNEDQLKELYPESYNSIGVYEYLTIKSIED